MGLRDRRQPGTKPFQAPALAFLPLPTPRQGLGQLSIFCGPVRCTSELQSRLRLAWFGCIIFCTPTLRIFLDQPLVLLSSYFLFSVLITNGLGWVCCKSSHISPPLVWRLGHHAISSSPFPRHLLGDMSTQGTAFTLSVASLTVTLLKLLSKRKNVLNSILKSQHHRARVYL